MPTILYFHGNAGNIGSRIDKIFPFSKAGYGILLAGYRGYGGNAGSPSEQGLLMDGRAALAFLAAQGATSENIVLYGESLGTGVAVPMAVEAASSGAAVRALVLEAPFTSVVEVASSFYPIFPVRWLLKDRFDSAAIIARIGTPVFVYHGVKDTTIPIRFGRKLYDLAVDPKESLWVKGAGHNDLFAYEADLAVLEFLQRQIGPTPKTR